MAYCTYSDLEMRLTAADLAALADHDGDGAADSDVVERAVADAGALIDSYLSVKFSVPVSPVPDVLRTCAVNLAVYFLRLGRDSVTEDVRAQCQADINWLRDVAAGSATLGIEPSPQESSGAPGVRYEGQERIFGRDEPL